MSESLRSHSKCPHISRHKVNVMVLLSSSRPKSVMSVMVDPWLARAGSALFTVPFMGSFLLLGIVALAGLFLMSDLNVPASTYDLPPENSASLN